MNFWTWLDRNGLGALCALIVCATIEHMATGHADDSGCRIHYSTQGAGGSR